MSEGSNYRVCGGILKSDLNLTELPRAKGTAPADWTLTIEEGEPPLLEGEVLGEDQVTPSATVRLIRAPDLWRLDFTDTGCFDLTDGGATIRWYPRPDSDPAAAAVDVIGRVLAVSFHAAGMICLHGSAVAFRSGTIAFLGPKFHGKSTTALALARSGARLVTDDMLPVELVDPPRAHPGVHAVRLWSDSAEQVGVGDEVREGLGGKLVLDGIAAGARMDEVSDLLAIYLMRPVADTGVAPAAKRARTDTVEASIQLIAQNKIGVLLGRSEAPVLLDRTLALAELVPVYRLEVARDFERLPELVAALKSWHEEGAEGAAPGGERA